MICPSDAEGQKSLDTDWHIGNDPTLPYLPCEFNNQSYTYTGYLTDHTAELNGATGDLFNSGAFSSITATGNAYTVSRNHHCRNTGYKPGLFPRDIRREIKSR